jgi:hypothetical protein
MNKVDVVIIAAAEFDSPMIRDFIHRYHSRFNKIHYIFDVARYHVLTQSENSHIDFITNDLVGKCDITICRHESNGIHDWRSIAMNLAIDNSNADYIFSFEPDFIGDWDRIVDIMLNQEYVLFGNYTAGQRIMDVRLWPSFWGCRMSNLKKTDRNFSAMPNLATRQSCGVSYNKAVKFFPPFDGTKDFALSAPMTIANKKTICVIDGIEDVVYDHFDYVSTQIMEHVVDDGKQLLLLNRMPDIWWEHMTGITYDYLTMALHNKLARQNTAYTRFYELCRNCNVAFYDKWLDASSKILAATL